MCVGMGLFGLFVLIALRYAPTSPGTQSLTYVSPQVPEAKLRFVWLDARQTRIAGSPLIAKLRKLSPDYLLAENVDLSDLTPLSQALGMDKNAVSQNFPLTDGKASGVCAMSKYPLLDGKPLSGIPGISAVSTVQGRKFMVAMIRTGNDGDRRLDASALIAYWRLDGASAAHCDRPLRSSAG